MVIGGDYMPAFHETVYGKRFFDKQLPELIKTLTRIADVLEALEEVNKTYEEEESIGEFLKKDK